MKNLNFSEKEWFDKGLELGKQGNHEEAIKAYDKTIEINPKNKDAWFNKGTELGNQGNLKEAINAFDKIIEINPDNENAWYNKGVALINLKEYEEAIKAFEKVIDINPKNENAWFYKGLEHNFIKEHYEALKAFKRVIDINPKNEIAWYNKGVQFGKLNNYKKALNNYEKAINIKHDYINALLNKGSALSNLKKHKKAIKTFMLINKINQNAEAWVSIGIEFDKLNKNKDALSAFEKAIETNRNNYEAWNNKAVELNRIEKYKDAIKTYKKAIDINPEKTLAYNNLTELFINLGDIKTATEKNKETLNNENNSSLAIFFKGKINIEEKKYDEAGESFQKAISLDYGNPNFLLWHAYANYLKAEFSLNLKDKKYIREKKYQEEISSIIRELEKANQLISNKKNNEKEEVKAYILYFLACFYIKSNDIFAAKEKLEECIKLKSSIKKSARELLRNLWNYKIKPSWWQWWLSSPLNCWLKKIVFYFISISVTALFTLHPFIPKWFPSLQINWTLYIFAIILLIIIILSPCIEHIKTKDIEVDLRSPTNLDLNLSPIKMENQIDQIMPPN